MRLEAEEEEEGAEVPRAPERPGPFLKRLSLLFALLLGLPFLCLSAWGACFGFTASFVCLGLFLPVLLLSYKKPSPTFIAAYLASWLAINAFLVPDSLRRYDEKRVAWFAEVKAGRGLGLKERIGVYGLNAVMALLGLPFSPEASRETFYLMLPAKEGKRRFASDFFLGSAKLRAALAGRGGAVPVRVAWSPSDYAVGSPESRYALALNPCRVSILEEGGRSLCRAECRIEYPGAAEVLLMDKPLRIVCEEGLFGYLQRIGWLHPYDAAWEAELPPEARLPSREPVPAPRT